MLVGIEEQVAEMDRADDIVKKALRPDPIIRQPSFR
jgi:hypothetical protein